MLSKLLTSLLIVFLLVPMTHACTAFVVYRNGLALAGNNEDFWITDTKIWFVPKEGSKRGLAGEFGRVYFGFDNYFPQGGMNEAGLFFDGFATSENKIKKSTGKPHFDGNVTDKVMANCKTVSEVVAEFEKHNLSFLANAMLMFSDRYGDSVIIEGDEFLRIKGDHQVVTNFYQSMTPAGQCPCSRYETAIKALGNDDPVTVDACRNVLAATRQNGKAPTQYSNVYDLKKGLIYLYHFHNFEEVVCLNLEEELKKGAHEIELPSLFSNNQQFDDFKEKRQKEIRDKTEAMRSENTDSIVFEDFVGTFAFDVGRAKKVNGTFSSEENRLYFTTEINAGKTKKEIYPEATDRFFRIGDRGVEAFKFRRSGENKVTGVSLKVLGRTFQGTRLE